MYLIFVASRWLMWGTAGFIHALPHHVRVPTGGLSWLFSLGLFLPQPCVCRAVWVRRSTQNSPPRCESHLFCSPDSVLHWTRLLLMSRGDRTWMWSALRGRKGLSYKMRYEYCVIFCLIFLQCIVSSLDTTCCWGKIQAYTCYSTQKTPGCIAKQLISTYCSQETTRKSHNEIRNAKCVHIKGAYAFKKHQLYIGVGHNIWL